MHITCLQDGGGRKLPTVYTRPTRIYEVEVPDVLTLRSQRVEVFANWNCYSTQSSCNDGMFTARWNTDAEDKMQLRYWSRNINSINKVTLITFRTCFCFFDINTRIFNLPLFPSLILMFFDPNFANLQKTHFYSDFVLRKSHNCFCYIFYKKHFRENFFIKKHEKKLIVEFFP